MQHRWLLVVRSPPLLPYSSLIFLFLPLADGPAAHNCLIPLNWCPLNRALKARTNETSVAVKLPPQLTNITQELGLRVTNCFAALCSEKGKALMQGRGQQGRQACLWVPENSKSAGGGRPDKGRAMAGLNLTPVSPPGTAIDCVFPAFLPNHTAVPAIWANGHICSPCKPLTSCIASRFISLFEN